MRWLATRPRLQALALMLLAAGFPAHAHDLPGVAHAFGPSATSGVQTSNLPEAVKSFYRAYVAEGNERTRAVLVNAFVWPVPSRLTVCFSGGPLELRPKIAAAMREWDSLSAGNITFVFTDPPADKLPDATGFKECDGVTPHKIRIGFAKGGGHWSQIGTLSETVFPSNSMNLDFDKSPLPDDRTVRGITLHEAGHALGFHHEHQSPGAPCKDWAWDKILVSYNWAGFTEADRIKSMKFNLDRLNDDVLTTGQRSYTFTTYNPDSIMHYAFPASMFTDGNDNPCRVDERYELSSVDKEAMKDAYARQRVPGERSRSVDAALANPRLNDSVRALLNQQKQRYPDQ